MLGRSAPEAVLCLLVLRLCSTVSEQTVGKCPQNKTDWDRESVSRRCQEPNYYHCLSDDTGHFTQLCAPRVWIQKGMCPEFNSKVRRIDVFECRLDLTNCPKTIFWSNAVFLFPECYRKSIPAITTSTTTPPSTTRAASSTTRKRKDNNNTDLFVILASVLTIVSICVIIIGVLIKRRLRRRGSDEEEDSEAPISIPKRTKTSDSMSQKEQEKMLGTTTPEEPPTRHFKLDDIDSYQRIASKREDQEESLYDTAKYRQNGSDEHCILIILHPGSKYVDNSTIKTLAQKYLNITVDVTIDFNTWNNRKTEVESAYVFKDWVASYNMSNKDALCHLKGEVLKAVEDCHTKFVFLIPFDLWTKYPTLKTLESWPKCIKKWISLTSEAENNQ